MNIKRLIAAPVVVGAVAILGACQGTGQVSPNGESYTATWERDFQLQAGLPIVYVSYQCGGDTAWRESPGYGFNSSSPATHSITVYCGGLKIQSAFPNDRHS